MTPRDEMEELSQLIQVPLTAGTINRGSNVVAAGRIFTVVVALSISSTSFRFSSKRLGRCLWHGYYCCRT